MAVPRSRLSNARKNIRRSHHAKQPKNFVKCANCGTNKLPHHICGSCGSYHGEQILVTKEKTEE